MGRSPKHGSTPQQYAYAKNLLGGNGRTKKDIALNSGFSLSSANTPKRIEKSVGFHNAMTVLAEKSNNMMLKIYHEYEARGLKNFSDKDLNGALNALTSSWEKIEKQRTPPKTKDPDINPLRQLFMQKVENQVIHVDNQADIPPPPETITVVAEEKTQAEKENIDMDF